MTHGYNAAGQLGSITRTNDAYAWTDHYAVQRAYTTNGRNQYSQTASTGATTTLGYDENGNLTSDQLAGSPTPPARTYTYDVENRLVGASNGTTLAYDPLGRLYQVTLGGNTTRFLYDGDALVAEFDASGTLTRRYPHNVGADVPMLSYEYASGVLSQVRYLHANHQGSIVALSSGSGGGPTINRYDEYGIPGSGNTGRFQYTGQIWLPELGMYHYKGRVYSPTLGRFLQVDPIGYEDRFNLYAYVGNDPVNGTDPTGTTCTAASAATDETPPTTICQDARNLDLSSNGAKNIIGFEGARASAYQNGRDVPTIGIGHTAGVQMGDTMTPAQMVGAFQADVNVAEGIVENLVDQLPLSQHEFDALVDLAFNVGGTELSASNSPGLNSAIAAGDYVAIGDNLRYTQGPNGPSPALAERSNSRQSIFRNGDYRNGVNRYNGLLNSLRHP